MARGDKNPYGGDLNKLSTRPYAGQTSQERVEAARVHAAGRPQPPDNPGLQAWAKGEVESRASRLVMGLYENKGRAPGFVLSEQQFTQFQTTGEWEGMPTPKEYGPQSAGPDDREWIKR